MKRTMTNSLTMVVAKNLATWRKARGYSQTQVSEQLTEAGWPASSASPHVRVSKIEAGHVRSLTIDELAIIAKVMGVEPWSLTAAPACDTCHGAPPPGFSCIDCGRAMDHRIP